MLTRREDVEVDELFQQGGRSRPSPATSAGTARRSGPIYFDLKK
jgi:hypothetical protein